MSSNALRRAATLLALAIATAVPAGLVQAQTAATGWTQYQGDAAHSGTLADGPEPPYRVRWTRPAPEGASLSGAVILGELAITLGDRAVYAIDLETGEVSWEVARDGGPLSIPAATSGSDPLVLFVDGPGATTEPAPATGSTSALTGTPSGPPEASVSPSPGATSADGEVGAFLVAIDPATQEEAWRRPLTAASRTGVTVGGDTAYVGDLQGNVTAVDVADGAVRWTTDVGGRVDVPLAAAGDVVVAVSRDVDAREITISALGVSDGEPVWEPRAFQLGSTAASAPAVSAGSVFVGLPDRSVSAFAVQDGGERWRSLALSVFSPATAPAASEGSVYMADLGGGLYALDPLDGARRWTYQFNELVLRSAPVRAGGAVLLGLQDGRLVALDDVTGHLVWQGPRTPGLIGAIALAPDVVVAVKGGRDAGLIAFEPDPTGRLIDVPTPTELDAGTTLPRVAVAAVIALVITLAPGMLARRRFGDAFVPDEDEGAVKQSDE